MNDSTTTAGPSAAPNGQVADRRTARRVALAEQRHRDADAELERQGRAELQKLELREARLEAARRRRESHRRQVQARRNARRARRAARRDRVRAAVPRWAERALFIGPILFPMAVAWIGQMQYARTIMGWPLAGAIVFAAGFELSTVYVARLDWKARGEGDSSIVFRAATWMFAALAATMNYWHAADPGFRPNGEAVSYGAMSVAGIMLWELLSTYRHRSKLRAAGKLPPRRPRFGLARWIWFPRITHLARLLALRDGYTQTEQAWRAALDEAHRHGSVRAAVTALRRGEASLDRDQGAVRLDASGETRARAANETVGKMRSQTRVETTREIGNAERDETYGSLNGANGHRRPGGSRVSRRSGGVKDKMIRYVAAQRRAGQQVSGADLDRRFGTVNYGSRVLRELDARRS